jgi:carboxyl-terminal processing protease
MDNNKTLLILILSLSLFASCKKDKVAPSLTLTPAMARDSLYDVMNEWYYWNEVMPAVNKTNYADPYLLMDAMRYKPLDKWSFVADYDQFMAEMEGSFVGHGFRMGLDDADNARISLIYSRSPLYAEGVRRGWIVKKINNKDVAPVLLARDPTAYINLIGPGEAGITNTFLFQKPDGTEQTITSTKSEFSLNSVILYDTLHLSSGITGHIVFDSFIQPSGQELATAFSYLASNGAKDLILDLRYNGGGYLYIAQQLASYIAGNAYKGNDFIRLTFNSNHQSSNATIPLISTDSPLSLSRILFITSRGTASASESVMNGLVPFMNVISIGDTTDGKPVGMSTGEIGKKYFIAPITFKYVNKNGQGDFFDGIAPDVLISDDISHDFNDRQELCLKAAISYLETGSVSGKSSMEFKRHPQYSEKPEWMKNAFFPAR